MRKPPAPAGPPPGRRHPLAGRGKVRRTPSPAQVSRWRAQLIRLRGADPRDRPDYVAYLTWSGGWMDRDWTTATDAQVISRMIHGEEALLPPDAPERVAARATIRAGFAQMRAREATGEP
ncbi:hypothetical protein BH09PSE2_BH09PSE2_26260 [soil metagenome]